MAASLVTISPSLYPKEHNKIWPLGASCTGACIYMTRTEQLWCAEQVANLFAGNVPFRHRYGGERSNMSSWVASLGMAGKGRVRPVVRLAIAKDFLAEYAKLDKSAQRAVDAAIAKFAKQAHDGLYLETPQHSRDDRIRTIRDRQPLARCRARSRNRRHVLPDHGPAAREGECLRRQPPVQRQPGAGGAGSPRRGRDPATATVPSRRRPR